MRHGVGVGVKVRARAQQGDVGFGLGADTQHDRVLRCAKNATLVRREALPDKEVTGAAEGGYLSASRAISGRALCRACQTS